MKKYVELRLQMYRGFRPYSWRSIKAPKVAKALQSPKRQRFRLEVWCPNVKRQGKLTGQRGEAVLTAQSLINVAISADREL